MMSARRGKTGGHCKQHSPSVTSLIPLLTGYHGNDCSSSVDQCLSNPCDPDGTLFCEELANTYRCVCQHGYTGMHCTSLINHCVEGLCQHGSVCVGLSRGFKCDCLPGGFTIQQGLVSNGGNSPKWMMYIADTLVVWCFHLFSFLLCGSLISSALSNNM